MTDRIVRGAALLFMALLAGCISSANSATSRLAIPLREAGVLAGNLGAGLSADALRMASDAEYRALEVGQTGLPVAWKASDAVFGSVVPQQPYSVGGTNCRRYSHTISVSGATRAATGTACRQENGTWRPLT